MFKRIFAFLVVGMNLSHANVTQTDQFKIMSEKILSEVRDNSLVIFDVDDVLIVPTDEFNTESPLRQQYKKDLGKKHGTKKVKVILSDFFRKRKVKLLDPEMPGFINQLKDKGVPVTALTAWWTGPFGTIERMEDLRFTSFKEMGLCFKEASPFKKDMDFTDRATENGTPKIVNGMILTALVSKGDILALALDTLKHKYTKIIFVDDRLKFLQSVQSMCQERGIEFVGIHYTKANTLVRPSHDEAKETERFRILETEHVWLTDKELDERAQQSQQTKCACS